MNFENSYKIYIFAIVFNITIENLFFFLEKADIFISYSRKDSNVVKSFVEKIKKAGYKVWIDYAGIYTGDAFKHVIVDAIENCDVFLFFASENSNSSMWTTKEIGVAIQLGKPVIPVRLDHSNYNKEVLFDLVNLDYFDYTDVAYREKNLEKFFASFAIFKSKQKITYEPTYKPTYVTNAKSGTKFTSKPDSQISSKSKKRLILWISIVAGAWILIAIVVYVINMYQDNSYYDNYEDYSNEYYYDRDVYEDYSTEDYSSEDYYDNETDEEYSDWN